MRDDVIKIIASLKDVTDALILTQNIDYHFVQSLLVPALRRCGNPKLTVFADSSCALETYQAQAPFITGLGRRYRVVPVEMNNHFRFHPKTIFLTGKENAVLFVGSGNLTYGGFRNNAEIWSVYDTAEDHLGVFTAYRDLLRNVVKISNGQPSLVDDIEQMFEPESNDWAKALPEPEGLLWRAKNDKSLISDIESSLEGKTVTEIRVLAPYFDEKAQAVNELYEVFNPERMTVFVQSGQTNLTQAAAALFNKDIQLKPVKFKQFFDDDEKSAFIHAKVFAFLTDNGVEVFLGSANCSYAALLAAADSGNSEALVHVTMSQEEFDDQIMGELLEDENKLVLQESHEPDDHDPKKTLVLTNASYDYGEITITFNSSEEMIIEKLQMGTQAETSEFSMSEPGKCVVASSEPPALVRACGVLDGEKILSNAIWVDVEKELRTSSTLRNLVDLLDAEDREKPNRVQTYLHALDLLSKHLSQNPKSWSGSTDTRRDSKDSGIVYSIEDIYADSYEQTPVFHAGSFRFNQTSGMSFSQLMKSWLGLGNQHDEVESEEELDDESNERLVEQVSVSKPEKDEAEKKKSESTPNDREVKLINKSLDQLVSALTNPEHLYKRSPEHLAVDIQLLASVLTVGLKRSCVSHETFLNVTSTVWRELFFSHAEAPYGYLSMKRGDKSGYIEKFTSSQLTASLYGWVLALETLSASKEKSLCSFMAAVSIARDYSIWHTENHNELNGHLSDWISGTELLSEDQRSLNDFEAELSSLSELGMALRKFESGLITYVGGNSIVKLRKQIEQDVVAEGEFVWQSPKLGFGVCQNQSPRKENFHTIVDTQGRTSVKIGGNFLTPILGILNSKNLVTQLGLDGSELELLRSFFTVS